jgi:hypothetical protein
VDGTGRGNGERDMRTSRSRVETTPELRPWREVGWIFRDGAVLAIERQGDRTRVRTAPGHQRDN